MMNTPTKYEVSVLNRSIDIEGSQNLHKIYIAHVRYHVINK